MVYVDMVLAIYNLVEGLASWLEGCSCHEHFRRLHSRRRANTLLAQELGVDRALCDCPMKGKRAPELAVGRVRTVFDSFRDAVRNDLTVCMVEAALTASQQHQIMSDLESGLAYLQLGLDVKFDCWARLPWKLAGLAHHIPEIARQVAAECLAVFDEFIGEDTWGM